MLGVDTCVSIEGINFMFWMVQIALKRRYITNSEHRRGGSPEISMLRRSLGDSMAELVKCVIVDGIKVDLGMQQSRSLGSRHT